MNIPLVVSENYVGIVKLLRFFWRPSSCFYFILTQIIQRRLQIVVDQLYFLVFLDRYLAILWFYPKNLTIWADLYLVSLSRVSFIIVVVFGTVLTFEHV